MRTADGIEITECGSVYDQDGVEWLVKADGIERKVPIYFTGSTPNRFSWRDVDCYSDPYFSTEAAALKARIADLMQQRFDIDVEISDARYRIAALATETA